MNSALTFAAIAIVTTLGAPAGAGQTAAPATDRWAAVRFLIGTWETTSEGQAGSGTGTRQYRFELRERYIEGRATATYPPQEKNTKGEVHEDIGYISYDRARKRLVFRQFHAEGFVNQYVADEAPGSGKVVFTSESIENIPPGFRARETWIVQGPDAFEEIFEIAEPGQDFALYSRTKLKRVSGTK